MKQFLLLSFMVLILGGKAMAQRQAGIIGSSLPPFVLHDLAGNEVTHEGLYGKVVLLNFWFTTCAPCLAEIPALNDLRAAFRPEEVIMWSMAPDGKEKVRAFLDVNSFNFRHFPAAGAYIANFGMGYPKNILIDKKGRVRFMEGGLAVRKLNRGRSGDEYLVDASRLREKLLALLNE